MEKKLIFLDVDGTLVNYEGKIPVTAIRAIHKARENGHRIYLVTGRSKAEIYPEIWEIGFDGMIGGNGSYVEDDGEIVMHQLISKEQCIHIVDWLHTRGLEFYLESNNGLFASEHFETVGQSPLQKYSAQKGKNGSDCITVRDVFPNMIFGGELYRDDLNKVSYVLNSYQDFLDAKKEFADLENGTWGGVGETALFGDIGVKGITKGNAIARLLEYLGMEEESTIAFGDAKIDIPMLEYCHIGVAMGNGGKEVRDIADIVTEDVNQDGLYLGFERLGLLK